MPVTAQKHDNDIREASGPAVVLFITEHMYAWLDPIVTNIRFCTEHAKSHPETQQYALVGSVVACHKSLGRGSGTSASWADLGEALTFDGLHSTTSW